MPNENGGWITGCRGGGQKPSKTAEVLAVVVHQEVEALVVETTNGNKP